MGFARFFARRHALPTAAAPLISPGLCGSPTGLASPVWHIIVAGIGVDVADTFFMCVCDGAVL